MTNEHQKYIESLRSRLEEQNKDREKQREPYKQVFAPILAFAQSLIEAGQATEAELRFDSENIPTCFIDLPDRLLPIQLRCVFEDLSARNDGSWRIEGVTGYLDAEGVSYGDYDEIFEHIIDSIVRQHEILGR